MKWYMEDLESSPNYVLLNFVSRTHRRSLAKVDFLVVFRMDICEGDIAGGVPAYEER